MKAVPDTNVLISAVITNGICHEIIVRGFKEDYELVLSKAIAKEFVETLADYPDKFGMTLDEIQKEARMLKHYATLTTPRETLNEIEKDPDDNKFLEAAVASESDFIITGDPHLKDLEQFRDIKIVNPQEFLDKIDQNS